MARTFTNANAKVEITSIRVLVYDDISAWKDLCSLDGYSRVQGLSMSQTNDDGRWAISCDIIDVDAYRSIGLSLDPTDPASSYNVCGSSGTDPLLGAYHQVKIYMTKSGSTEQLIFQGYVGPGDAGPTQSVSKSDIFSIDFVGIMQPIVDHWITEEEALVYSDTYISIGQARDCLSQIMYDYGHDPIIVIEDDDLNFYVNEYEVTDTSIYTAINEMVSSIGYLLIEKYGVKIGFRAGSAEFTRGETVTSSGGKTGKVVSWVVTSGTWEAGTAAGYLYLTNCSGTISSSETLTGSTTGIATSNSSSVEGFRISVVDPDRTNVTPEIDLGYNANYMKLTYSEVNVRTWVQVVYKDRYSGKGANVISYNTTAQNTYGIPDGSGGRLHKKMRIVETDGSLIDTRAEAQLEADLALLDVSSPSPDIEVKIPWLVLGVELGDMVEFDTDTDSIKFGVTSIAHSLSASNLYGETTLSGTIDRRVGNVAYWLRQSRTDLIGQIIQDHKELTGIVPVTPENLSVESIVGDMNDGTAAPVLHATWSSTRDWRTTAYRLETMQSEEEFTGTATSNGTTTTLTDSTKTWAAAQLVGKYLYIPTATRGGDDQIRRIIGNTATTIRTDLAYTTAVVSGETYHVLNPITEWVTQYVDRKPVTQVEGLPSGKYIITRVAAVPKGLER